MEGRLARRHRKKRLGLLGPAFSFSDIVAKAHFPQSDYEYVYFKLIPEIIEAVVPSPPFARGTGRIRVDMALVPAENSSGGSVGDTVDTLLQVPEMVYLNQELVLLVEQCLIVGPQTEKRIDTALSQGSSQQEAWRQAISHVTSHPQSLLQCRYYLRQQFPDVVPERADSNSAAVQIAISTEGVAALGPERAAAEYGGFVLARGVQDAGVENKTRFWILDDRDYPYEPERSYLEIHDESPDWVQLRARLHSDYKTLVVFTLPDYPGSIDAAFKPLTMRGINKTSIASKPTGKLGWYLFLLEIEGHRLDPTVSSALELMDQVSGNSGVFKVLGSYLRVGE